MSALLDTHVLLWWLANDDRLGGDARALIADDSTTVWVSAASVWEIAIKRSLGKLDAPSDLLEQIDASRFTVRPLDGADLWFAGHLPGHHRDPFDRAIVAQALRGGLRLITRDTRLADYGVEILVA